MSLRNLKQRADRLASEAHGLRVARDRHAAKSLELVRLRIGSPAGLALSFGTGFAVGLRSPKRDAQDSGPGISEKAARLLEGPLGAATIKLAAAVIAGAMVRREQESGDDGGQPETAAASAQPSQSAAGVAAAPPFDGSRVK